MHLIRKKNNKNLLHRKDPREFSRENYQKKITLSSKNQTQKGVILNISRSGAFIATKKKLHLGQVIYLKISGDSLFKNLKLKGLIVRKDSDGVGVKFDRRTGLERRYDLDRRRNPDRRRKTKFIDL